jgi:hypothetical protein
LNRDSSHARAALQNLGVLCEDALTPTNFLEKLVRSTAIVTDSAGVAEEAQLLGLPLLVFRTSAEARIDGPPSGPVCTTESVEVAQEFLGRVLRERRRPVVTAAEDAVSVGVVVASEIEGLALNVERHSG